MISVLDPTCTSLMCIVSSLLSNYANFLAEIKSSTFLRQYLNIYKKAFKHGIKLVLIHHFK